MSNKFKIFLISVSFIFSAFSFASDPKTNTVQGALYLEDGTVVDNVEVITDKKDGSVEGIKYSDPIDSVWDEGAVAPAASCTGNNGDTCSCKGSCSAATSCSCGTSPVLAPSLAH